MMYVVCGMIGIVIGLFLMDFLNSIGRKMESRVSKEPPSDGEPVIDFRIGGNEKDSK